MTIGAMVFMATVWTAIFGMIFVSFRKIMSEKREYVNFIVKSK